jgi:hypothetical protein
MLIAELAKVSRSFTGPELAGLSLEYLIVDKEACRKVALYCRRCGFWSSQRMELTK